MSMGKSDKSMGAPESSHQSTTADQLTGRHVGTRVRVTTASGAVVEDVLTGFQAGEMASAGENVITVRFAIVAPTREPDAWNRDVFTLTPSSTVELLEVSKI